MTVRKPRFRGATRKMNSMNLKTKRKWLNVKLWNGTLKLYQDMLDRKSGDSSSGNNNGGGSSSDEGGGSSDDGGDTPGGDTPGGGGNSDYDDGGGQN